VPQLNSPTILAEHSDLGAKERKVKGNEKLLTVLNQLLADELTAINQYMVHRVADPAHYLSGGHTRCFEA
jgi:hypothetical protein